MSSVFKSPRSRLTPLRSRLDPFIRAGAVEDISLYWLPVSGYPIPSVERQWLLEFLRRLKVMLAEKAKLREECFLQFKTLYPDLLNQFTEKARDYMPLTGVTIAPGKLPPKLPTLEEIKEQVEKGKNEQGAIDVNRWLPDHAHWFLVKQGDAQREDFFGFGGMFMLYLKPDLKAQPPVLNLPRIVKTHPAYTADAEGHIAAVYALQDSFLAKSKEIFGGPFREDPGYKGLLFVLPLLNSSDFVNATPEKRAEWFGLFDAYCIESKADNGILLALKDPLFDEDLIQLLEDMRESGYVYRI